MTLLSLLVCLAGLSPLAAEAAAAPVPVGPGARADAKCELGIVHAYAGDLGRAESLFVEVLSLSPRDGRALTNLGNVALLRGDRELALAFYDRAASADTTDGGIRLNRAIALALRGDEAESQAEAREGIRLAGNAAAAGSLLGLRSDGDSAAFRGTPSPHLTREEVRDMLRTALRGVAVDTTGTNARAGGRLRPGLSSRSAGPRADEMVDPGASLYWKR